jgi:hypothetical protein
MPKLQRAVSAIFVRNLADNPLIFDHQHGIINTIDPIAAKDGPVWRRFFIE